MLSGCRVEVGYFDVPALSEYKDLIEYQGWMSLFDCSAANLSGVRDFYVNLKQLPDMSIGSNVGGVDVSMSVSSVSSMLGVPRDGFDKYLSDSWPMLVGVTPDEIMIFFFVGKCPRSMLFLSLLI